MLIITSKVGDQACGNWRKSRAFDPCRPEKNNFAWLLARYIGKIVKIAIGFEQNKLQAMHQYRVKQKHSDANYFTNPIIMKNDGGKTHEIASIT